MSFEIWRSRLEPSVVAEMSGATVGLVLLYVIGGIGVGMFFMMRKRYVLWRHAAALTTCVAAANCLAIGTAALTAPLRSRRTSPTTKVPAR